MSAFISMPPSRSFRRRSCARPRRWTLLLVFLLFPIAARYRTG